MNRQAGLRRLLRRLRGLDARIDAVGWDYVSPRCEERRQSHNATDMPKVP